jgi:hypothetical protein
MSEEQLVSPRESFVYVHFRVPNLTPIVKNFWVIEWLVEERHIHVDTKDIETIPRVAAELVNVS